MIFTAHHISAVSKLVTELSGATSLRQRRIFQARFSLRREALTCIQKQKSTLPSSSHFFRPKLNIRPGINCAEVLFNFGALCHILKLLCLAVLWGSKGLQWVKWVPGVPGVQWRCLGGSKELTILKTRHVFAYNCQTFFLGFQASKLELWNRSLNQIRFFRCFRFFDFIQFYPIFFRFLSDFFQFLDFSRL